MNKIIFSLTILAIFITTLFAKANDENSAPYIKFNSGTTFSESNMREFSSNASMKLLKSNSNKILKGVDGIINIGSYVHKDMAVEAFFGYDWTNAVKKYKARKKITKKSKSHRNLSRFSTHIDTSIITPANNRRPIKKIRQKEVFEEFGSHLGFRLMLNRNVSRYVNLNLGMGVGLAIKNLIYSIDSEYSFGKKKKKHKLNIRSYLTPYPVAIPNIGLDFKISKNFSFGFEYQFKIQKELAFKVANTSEFYKFKFSKKHKLLVSNKNYVERDSIMGKSNNKHHFSILTTVNV